MCLAVYIVNLGYGFDGTGMRLRNLRFISRSLTGHDFASVGPGNRFADCWFGAMPVPLPRQYVLGLDHQRRDFEVFPMKSYLRGEWKQGGWWYYYLYALVIKTPLALLCLLCLVALFGLHDMLCDCRAAGCDLIFMGGPDRWWGIAILVAPAVNVFVLASAQTTFNHHFRYVLPVLGPMFVLASSLAERARRSRRGGLGAIVIVCLAWMGVSSVRHGWESLSYFNELIGGPKAGRFHLLHSNLDWGQDLLRLKAWQAEHPDLPALTVAYCGLYEPADLGLRVNSVAADKIASKSETREPTWYAISVNYLMGSEWPPVPFDCSAFATREPCALCGASIAVFRVP
jgi:hypothetical protein